jgi:urease accessory protein
MRNCCKTLQATAGSGFLPTEEAPAINTQTQIAQTNAPPRARGTAFVSSKRHGAATVLDGLRQSGSLRVMFPRSAEATMTGVFVNCAGGLTGGDRFEISAQAGRNTQLVLTTQAAERIYRATDATPARLSSELSVAAGATLHWLPQETILFDQSRLRRKLEVTLAHDARLLMVEPVVFGRTSMGEAVRKTSFQDDLRITRGDTLIHAEATRLDGDAHAQLQNPALTGGGVAVASVILAAPDAERHLQPARQIIGAAGGASLKAPDLLCIRLVARDSQALRKTAMPLLTALTNADLPRTWMI